ncbi:MAG: HYR domain-containing protein [Saprospiraceae bacterium]
MNRTTTPRRWALAVATIVCLFLAQRAHSQCSDFDGISGTPPFIFSLPLDAMGNAPLTEAVLASRFIIDPACQLWLSDDSLGVYTPAPHVFTCADVNTTQTWFVRAGGDPAIGDDGGPGSTIVRITVNIFDNTPPTTAGSAIPPVSLLTSDDGTGDCSIVDVFTSSGGVDDIAISFDAAPVNQHFFYDNCPDSLRVTWELSGATVRPETNASGSFIEILPLWYDAGLDTYYAGVTTVTYRIYDHNVPSGAGNPLVITTTVTVTDNENPDVSSNCPPNQGVTTNPGVCTYSVNNYSPMYSDNCEVVDLTWTAPGASPNVSPALSGINPLTAVFPLGTTTVTFEVADAAGNTDVCSFDITVTDGELPVLTCPTDMTVSADAPPSCVYTPSMGEFNLLNSTDNCGIVTIFNNINFTNNLDGQPLPLGLNNVIWTAEDAAANAGTCSFFVTVVDNLSPQISTTLTTYYPVAVTPGDCSKAITFDRPNFLNTTVTDCEIVTWSQGTAVVNGTPDPGILSGVPVYDPFNIFGLFPVTTTFPVGTTLIPYYFTDLSGNVDSIVIEFFVEENILPTAKCVPGTITLALNSMGQATLTKVMVDDGSFDNCVLDTITLSQTAFTCADLPGTHIVTLTAEDAVGNTATCTVTVDVVDNIVPQILCPGNKTVTTNAGCTANNVANIGMALGSSPLTAGQYSDNCAVTTVSWQLTGATSASGSGSVPAGQAFNVGVTNITYTVADASGNNAVCNFSVNVTDNTPPVWDGNGPANGDTISVNANLGGCVAQVTWTVPTFTDACTPPVNVTPPALGPGSSFPFGNTNVTYTAIDGAGNVRGHTFTVKVVDTQNPNAQCKNITTYLNAAGTTSITASQVNNLSTDNCFFTFTSANASYNCTNLGPNNYTLQITDGSGNTGTCVAVVTVADTIKPVANCFAISTVDLLPNGTATLTATALNSGSTDNTVPPCNLTFGIAIGADPFTSVANFNCMLLGNRVVTLRVTDAAGNTRTCSRTILVKDVTAPLITAPANTTINCNASSAPANTGTFSGVSDNCDPAPVVTQLADVTINVICPNSYTIVRTWRVTDASGNSATASHSIVVQDVQAPVFAIQDTFSVNTISPTSCSAPLLLQITAANVTDNCTTNFANLTITYTVDFPTPSYGFVDVLIPTPGTSIPGGAFPVGTTAVTWRVTDQCGRTATKTVFVVVKDIHGPAFSAAYSAAVCGKAYVLPNTTGACSNLFAWQRPNFGPPDVSDCLGFTVTEKISDTTVTTFLNLVNQFNYNTVSPFGINPTAQFPVGITTISYIAMDAAGNKNTCSFTVEVKDTQTPILTCPPNQILAATCPSAQVPNYTNLVSVSDNCSGNVVLTQTIPAAPGATTLGQIFAPNPPAAGNQFTVLMTGFDGYNTASCTFIVTLQDGVAPIPILATLPDLIDSCGSLIVFAPSALDPCNPNASIIYGTPSTPVGAFLNTTPPSYQLNPGSYVITWNYNDGNGNISTQPQNITVLTDVFPPVAICAANLTVNLDAATGKAPITPGMLNLGSFDPNMCGPLTFSVSPDTVNCAHVGPNPATVTLTVRDTKNNPKTCTTAVTVRDITSPVLTGAPANLTIEACDTIPAAPQLTATDACAGTYQVSATQVSNQNPINGINKYNYVITRTWQTADASGNSVVVVRTITVQDTKKPAFVGAPDTVMVVTDPGRQTCDDTVNVNILPFVSDCATGVDLRVTNNTEPGDGGNLSAIFSVGSHIVTFTAKDTTGNTQTRNVTVIVKDGTLPTAVCINGVSASLQPSGTVVVNTAQFNNNSYDNCPDTLDLRIQRLDDQPLLPASKTLTYDCSDADGVTKRPVRLFVTDKSGNKSMCETYIVIQDNVDPTITLCPANKTVLCTDTLSPVDHGIALVTDNCPDSLDISYSDAIVDDTSGQFCYKVERVWLVVDLAGNQDVCVQTFSILDTVAPVLSQYPPDVTLSCFQNLTPPVVVTATDNCSNFVGVTFVQDTINIASGPCGKYSYTIQRTRTAVDDCGNVEEHTNTITVVDNLPPAFPGLPDTITVQSVNFPPNDSCSVPVTLNLAPFIVDCAPVSELTVTNNSPFGSGGVDASGHYQVGTYQVKFTAIDPCGNMNQDSVVVIVIDNSKPIAACESATISLGSNGMATITAAMIDDNKSTDNCGIDTMYLDVYEFDCSNLGSNPVTLTVVDVHGNMNVCSTTVEVTLGNGIGFNLAMTSTAETVFGASNGTATASATGGSGNFTYKWSQGDLMSTIIGLPPGIYYVTATDATSGCFRVDSVTVAAGAKLTIIAGQAAGSQGEIVQVPVSVDNFTDMIGMSFSLHVTNPIVGTILSGTTTGVLPNPFTLSKVGNDLTVFWVNNGAPLDLPNGTVIFHLNVQLGTAPVGSTSPVTIDGTPTALSFQIDSAGNIVPTTASLIAGMVTIDSLAAADVEIAGIIQTWKAPVLPVPNVDVALTGSLPMTTVTGAPGTYSFLVPIASNTIVKPSKVVTQGKPYTGIDILDLLAIQFHAASVTQLTNPYAWVAADINNNGNVDIVDYLLVRQVILTLLHYSNGTPDWKFIPSAYVFPTPNPLVPTFPDNIAHTPANMDFLADNFTAVRMGDVTGDAPIHNIVSDVQDRSGEIFRFLLDEQPVRAGEMISVPFRASGFSARQAYQMTIGFDPNILELADVQPGVLPNFGAGNFGMGSLAEGHLTNLWVGSEPLTLPDGEVLFTLTFRALKNSGKLSDLLRPTSDVTSAFAVDAQGDKMAVQFNFGSASGSDNIEKTTFELYQNQPNPFREQTTIGFRLPQADRAVLRVFNVDGRLVKTLTGDFAQGFNTVTIPTSEIGAAGIYWYELETPTNSDRKKMILID